MPHVRHFLQDALCSAAPQEFLRESKARGELGEFLPEVACLYGVPQPPAHHPEIDTGLHVELTLERAAALSSDPRVRYAALVHDLGKALTPASKWPSHHGHEKLGVAPVHAVSTRLALPGDWRWVAATTARYHLHVHKVTGLRAGTWVQALSESGALDRPDLFELVLLACEADARGRAGLAERAYPQRALVQRGFEAVRAVEADEARLHQARCFAWACAVRHARAHS